MGRKEDEEEQGTVSKDTNGSCIEELTKKCKPLNVQLSRLELPKNGVIVIKDGTSGKLKNLHINSSHGGGSNAIRNVDKGENEDSSSDTAETIKKIKEFIALGRCEETKKDQELSDKKVGYKSNIVTKRKLSNKKDARTTSKKLSIGVERSNPECDLERTLKGQDSVSSVSDLNDCSGYSISDEIVEKNKDNLKHIDLHELRNTEYADSPMKSNELLFTPSRVSKRIQSKSVKFSVKKMLRGDDVNVLKRMIPGYQDNTPLKKERLTEKKIKTEMKKPLTPVKPPNPPPHEPSQEKEVVKTPAVSMSTLETVSNDTSVVNAPSPESIPHSTVETLIESKEKLATLTEKIGKFAIGNGKITVELKGSQQKKVVRIALPPTNTQSPLPNTSLGPDIIIKRVKPVKKTVVMPDNPALGMKGIVEKEVYVEPTNMYNISKDIKMLPRVNLERITTPKLKENLLKIQKNLFRHGRNEKKLDKADLKDPKSCSAKDDRTEINVISHENLSTISATEVETVSKVVSSANEPIKVLEGDVSDKSDSVSINSASENLEKVEKDLSSESAEKFDKSIPGEQEETIKHSHAEKNRGRKTAKVTPLTQVKSKTETLPRKPLNKVKKPETVFEKAHTSEKVELLEPEKETFNSLFDRYFSTKERYVEHHDSLDSDSSEDFNDEIYAHFINFRRQKRDIGYDEEKKDDSVTMYDLMQDITLELPTWNIHVTSDGQAFCLAQVDVIDNVPVMKKVIEIDLDYNAKVFVGGTVMPEYEGNYTGYEDIRQLIYDVDQL